MLAEAVEIARAGAAGIDRRGDAGGAAEFLGIDAERGAAPIHMGVQVDEARRDDMAGDIPNLGAGIRLEMGAHGGDLAVREGDIHHGVDFLRRIDDAPAAQDEIGVHGNLKGLKGGWLIGAAG